MPHTPPAEASSSLIAVCLMFRAMLMRNTGYDVRVNGIDTVIGGTSAVAPLWAGLIARINSNHGKTAGYINPVAYRNAPVFNDITQGNNGGFAATPGWDACTGMGSPNGALIASILNGLPGNDPTKI